MEEDFCVNAYNPRNSSYQNDLRNEVTDTVGDER